MSFEPSILLAALSLGVTERYYGLCDRFPLTSGVRHRKLTAKEVLNAAQGVLEISKLPGPGTVFQLLGLPTNVSLNFIIQSGGSVETDFSLSVDDSVVRGTFAILCNEAVKHQGLPPRTPGYPRPICGSAAEMIAAFQIIKALLLLLVEAMVARPE